jgi:DNA-binding NarL/FixJ family response regulator
MIKESSGPTRSPGQLGMEMGTMKSVFVLSRPSLLSQGIESLLAQEARLEIVNPEKDLSTAVESIQKHRPDVVIVNLDDPELDLSPAFLCILKERLGIRVIGLSLKENCISIYRGEHKEIRQVDDLLDAILN